MLISNGNHLRRRPPPRRRRAHRPPAAPRGGDRPQPVADLGPGRGRAPRAAHAERAGRLRAHPAPDGHARPRSPRGGGTGLARRRSRRPALVAGVDHAGGPRAARAAAHAQGRVPGAPARRPRRRGPRRARARGRHPGACARRMSRAFTSLHVPNYRRYFTGQIVSLAGNWMQIVAETWLVLRLTGSGALVGFAAALQFLPMLAFGALDGVLADRVSKRSLLMLTQGLMAVPAIALFALVETGAVQTWMVLGLILARGAVNSVDNPARQSFVSEMVGVDRVVNAVSLNSVIVHVARIAGPALAALVIALAGVGPCFAINAFSFVAMWVALRRMNPRALEPAPVASREPGQLRAAVRYVLATPELRTPLLMMAVIGTLSYNFQVLLPLLARFTWHGSASAYAALTCAMGVGSVAGALVSGARGKVGPGLLAGAAAAFGAATLVAAAAPSLALQMLVLAPLGAASVTFAAGVNSTMQLAADPALRGRVMALYSVVFLGSTPIGAPLIGWLAQASGPRAGLAVGGLAALATGIVAARAVRQSGGWLPAGAALSGD